MYAIGAMQGWQCPVCGRVLAPFITECPCHGNQQSTTISSTGTGNVTIEGDGLYKTILGQQKTSDARTGYATN